MPYCLVMRRGSASELARVPALDSAVASLSMVTSALCGESLLAGAVLGCEMVMGQCSGAGPLNAMSSSTNS